MAENLVRSQRRRSLRGPAVATLVRFLGERGLTDEQIERALEYVEESGVHTIRAAFDLAMSRTLLATDELSLAIENQDRAAD